MSWNRIIGPNFKIYGPKKGICSLSPGLRLQTCYWVKKSLHWRITATVQEHQTTGRQWSSNILAFQCQIFEGSQPPGKNRKKHDSDQQQSPHSCRFLARAIWRITATVQERQTTGRQWSSNILAIQCQIFEGSQPPGKNRKKHDSDQQQSPNSCRFLAWAIWRITQPCKNNPQKRWSAVILKYLGISVPLLLPPRQEGRKNQQFDEERFSQAYSHHSPARTHQKQMVSNDHQAFSPFQN